MSDTSDLECVQQKLNDLGVCDVKFFFTSAVRSMPTSDVTQDIALLLSTYLDKYRVPLELFGDTNKQ